MGNIAVQINKSSEQMQIDINMTTLNQSGPVIQVV